MELLSAVCHGVLLLLVALGVWDVMRVYESDRCSMTYMFEYPEFQKMKLPRKVSRTYPAYELYLYGEGAYAAMNKNLTLTGIPVLFLPGNAGSYKQARSVGSIALRKAENIGNVYHFDVFTVNFNEELVALYGGSLQRQTKFVHICIKAIIQLYKHQPYSPQSVAIIGHSMGGLVARALLTLKNFKPKLLNLIITQATPHVLPVLPVDYYLTDFYALVNNYWILNANELQNITTLSVAGGFRDYQVPSVLAFLPVSGLHNSALSVVSSAVPRTWASTDHLSIVWCKELILATTRALFDLIDENTSQLTDNIEKRMSVLRHHFVKHPAKFFESNYETAVSLPESARWVPVDYSTWEHIVTNKSSESYFTFSLSGKTKHFSHFHCQSTYMFTNSWIFGCNDKVSPECLQVEDLTWKSDLLPIAKVVTLKLEDSDYSTFTHFVVALSETNGSKFSLECEFLNEESRTVQTPVTHVLSFGLSSSHIKLNSTGLLHIIHLQEFSKIYQAFDILIERNCTDLTERTYSIYRFHVPWSHEDIIRTSSDNEFPLKISAKLHAAKPQNDTNLITVTIYSSADCLYEVTIYTSFLQILGQIIRFHGPSLPVYILSNLLLAYGAQLHSLLGKGHCLEFDSSLIAAAKPYKVDPIINMCRFLLSYTWFRNIWDGLLLPELDAAQLYSLGFFFPMASLLLFIFGTGVSYWSGVILKLTIRVLSSIWIALKRHSENLDSRCSVPRLFATILFLAFICWATCGAFTILLVFIHYLFKIVKLFSSVKMHTSSSVKIPKDEPDDKATDASQNDSPATLTDSSENTSTPEPLTHGLHQHSFNSNISIAADSLKMHIAIMNLLLWVMLLNFPTFVYWASNISALLKRAAQIQLPLAIVTVAFGTLHLYRVSYFISLSFFIHVLCCFI
uniref:GPI inositol-deacylase n=1 Tax=Leptobrachium leishanense TaxID=445787 RepID=A0A8C5QKJ3_9ANUR